MDLILRPIFVSLPLPRGLDFDSLLAGYHVALQDESLDALMRVVTKLVKGTWTEPVTFCPRPPELAQMVRQETRRMQAESAPRISSQPIETTSMYAQMAKKFANRKVLSDNLGVFAAFQPSHWPPGAVYVPLLGKVFAPQETAPPRPYHEPKGE